MRAEARGFRTRRRAPCSSRVIVEIENNIVVSAAFEGGCPGNTEGVCRLVKGRSVDEVIALLDGIDCGGKGTSCPDQMAQALRRFKEEAGA